MKRHSTFWIFALIAMFFALLVPIACLAAPPVVNQPPAISQAPPPDAQSVQAVTVESPIQRALAGLLGVVALGACFGMVALTGPLDDAMVLHASAQETTSAAGTGLNIGTGYAPAGGGLPVKATIQVTAIDRTTGNETYTFTLQESADDAASDPYVDIGAATVTITATGVIEAKGFLTKPYVRLNYTGGGTTPIITFKAWLNPVTVE